MLASPALAGVHSFAASVSGNLLIPLPSVPAPARRAALSVVAKVKVSTPQDDRIARHVRLRKKVLEICARAKLESFSSFLRTNVDINQCARILARTFSLCIRLHEWWVRAKAVLPSCSTKCFSWSGSLRIYQLYLEFTNWM